MTTRDEIEALAMRRWEANPYHETKNPSGLTPDEAIVGARTWFDVIDRVRAKSAETEQPAPERRIHIGSPEHVELWDSIEDVVAASGGNRSAVNGKRMEAVVRVEAAVRALLNAQPAPDRMHNLDVQKLTREIELRVAIERRRQEKEQQREKEPTDGS